MNMKNKGFTLVELLVVIGILGILMGALFPAISSAMLAANTAAMSMRGRNLFVGITQANTEREAAGLPSVWPHKTAADGLSDDKDDIAGTPWPSSTRYFETLFDTTKITSQNWSPYVTGVDLNVLSGNGVPAMSGSLTQNNVAWHVTAGITTEMEDIVPVLVSRNADASAFAKALGPGTHEMAKEKDAVTLGGKYAAPFGNKAMIVIHKGGAAKVVKSKYAKLYLVFDKQTFTVPQGLQLELLEP